MTSFLDDQVFAAAEFEQVQILQDRDAGLFGFIAIHSTRLGPAFGGIRRWAYERPDHALVDALRLAAHMTLKCAIHDIPGGGGKTVLIDRPGMDRQAAYRRLGQYVDAMGGRFYTGPDVGTEATDLMAVRSATRFVACDDEDGPGNLAEPTAWGVFAGIQAVARQIGFADLQGVRIVVQGLGEVGIRLVEMLAAAGARLQVTDVVAERIAAVQAAAAQHDWQIDVIDSDGVQAVPCDIYAPCALGGVVSESSLRDFGARAVAGSANNVLASADCGRELQRREILYAPDFVINSGALVHGSLFHLDGKAPPRERVEAIGPLLSGIFAESAVAGLSPEVVAEQRAKERLAQAPGDVFFPRPS